MTYSGDTHGSNHRRLAADRHQDEQPRGGGQDQRYIMEYQTIDIWIWNLGTLVAEDGGVGSQQVADDFPSSFVFTFFGGLGRRRPGSPTMGGASPSSVGGVVAEPGGVGLYKMVRFPVGVIFPFHHHRKHSLSTVT